MNSCLVLDQNQLFDKLIEICNSTLTSSRTVASNIIKKSIKKLVDESPNKSQKDLILKTLIEAYQADDEYGDYLRLLLQPNDITELFVSEYTQNTANRPLNFEEVVAEKTRKRERNLIGSKFKDAPNAKLYFRRSIKNDMVEAFLVRRSKGAETFFTSQEDMNISIREYKQQLLDRIIDFFKNTTVIAKQLPKGDFKMYDKNGNYTGILESLKSIINAQLDPKSIDGSLLDSKYSEQRDSINPQRKTEANLFLNAYNAWVTLLNFDDIVTDLMGSVINITSKQHYNKHTGNLAKYEIKNRASNMWHNWTSTDDIGDMSEVISDVCQILVETSKMYSWKNEDAFEDRYLSFSDFNYAIGLIKKLASKPFSKNISLDAIRWDRPMSVYTSRIFMSIITENAQNGIYGVNAAGKSNGIPEAPTLKSLISRLNENPQRYLHAIFDVICNSNIIDIINGKIEEDSKKIGLYEKNVLWSLNKEIFGASESDPRSLYRLHTLSPKDNIYQILTLVAASTFPEDYLQYYETHNGEIGTRLLLDYAKDKIKRTLYDGVKLASATFSPLDYNSNHITIKSTESGKFLEKVTISIPIISTNNAVPNFTFEMSATNLGDQLKHYSTPQLEQVWQSSEYQKVIKNLLGIDFTKDPDFRNAYTTVAGSIAGAVKKLNKLLGHVVYTSVVNNVFLPKHSNINKPSVLKSFITQQYGKEIGSAYEKGINIRTGVIPTLPISKQDTLLGELALAWAINHNLLSQALSKTGEGTSIANYTLSRMRNFYHNQVEMQCRRERSAVKNLDFIVNSNNLFEGILSRREFKTNHTNQQSTKFSDQQSFQLAFINDFLSGFIPNPNDLNYLKKGRVSFLPTVNSDKPQIDGLLVNLYAKSHVQNPNGTFKSYIELSDSEIELEMETQFKPMYDSIMTNINVELGKVYNLLLKSGLISDIITEFDANVLARRLAGDLNNKLFKETSSVYLNQFILDAINRAFMDNTSLGKKPKQRIINGLHKLLTEYNSTHSRNPIMLSPLVHYTFDDNGLLTTNKVLDALWGRFNSGKSEGIKQYLSNLYNKEIGYKAFLSRNGLTDSTNSESFFKWQDHLTVKDLLNMHFKIYLKGTNDKVRHTLEEIKFLKGEATFTEELLKSPLYSHIFALNNEMKNWVDDNGYMIIAKGTIDGVEVSITNLKLLNQATNLRLHPMLSKLNRLDYLCSLQYTVSTVGSHYVHSGKPAAGLVLVEEARRWLASNKRNVAATSTVHLFQNKLLDGSPTYYNIAIMEDVREDLYTIMGDLYKEGHAPLDGGMVVNGFIPELENNSLAGEGAGTDKKHFGTFYSELYAAGGIIKTAGFAATNDRMRRQKAWKNLQRLMSSRPWVKEYPGSDGADVQEVIDITKDYLNRPIDYNKVLNNQPVRYKRVAHDNPNEMAAYLLHHIESLGNNLYRIYEFEIDQHGNPISDVMLRNGEIYGADGTRYTNNTAAIVVINNNWDLFNEIFGGCDSLELGPNGVLTESENSRRFMAYALNNVGDRKDFSLVLETAKRLGEDELNALKLHLNTLEYGLDLDDIWLPLKHSDIHFTPNIGAIKSLQFNVNPDGNAVLEGTTVLNAFRIRLAQLGIQLDKEHHADASEVSMPTQIILALANKSFTPYAKEVYKALEVLTKQVTQPFLDGILDIITSDNPAQLTETVTNLILEKLISDSDEETTINSILGALVEKAAEGKELKYAEDIKGLLPWSNPTITSKLFSTLSTTLTSMAVKMDFSGTLSVICPAGPMEKLHGDRTLNSFNPVLTKEGSTRTPIADMQMEAYQSSVREGNEVDSDGRNMLVFDLSRDVILFPEQEPNESVEMYQKRIRNIALNDKLSKVSELKTQHNYIIEFIDGTTEKITLNDPDAYYRIKNLAVLGRKSADLIEYEEPLTYEDFLQGSVDEVSANFDFTNNPWAIVYNALSQPVITQESFLKETGLKKGEVTKLFGLFLSKAKGGVSIERLAEQIWEQNLHLFTDDYEVRNMIIDIVSSARTTGDIKSYEKRIVENVAKEEAVNTFNSYQDYIESKYKIPYDLYVLQYSMLKTNHIPIAKIYENVIDGRHLSAYNVRFTNKNTDPGVTQRFQIFDLDSVNLLFKLNSLNTNKNVTGEGMFLELDVQKQLEILNTIFNKKIFNDSYINSELIHTRLLEKCPYVPVFNSMFMLNLYQKYPNILDDKGNSVINPEIIKVINTFVDILKPRVYNLMQRDLFRLSEHYDKADRTIYANNQKIEPIDILADAYELIMPKIYKTLFGLQEFDDLQEILRDQDFFIRRGLKRFACKVLDNLYDYELKNFNGNHVYVLDASKGIPEELQQNIIPIEYDHIKVQVYRTDGHGKPLHRLSSSKDVVAEVGGVEVIITKNPLFYVLNFNYNTLKVSPSRVTEESYKLLTATLAESKRTNAKNFLKAIKLNELLFDLKTFKEFNKAMETITYDNIKIDSSNKHEFKSVALLCRILLNNGRELHTSFKESLNLIAGRIPAQSLQSFMTQKVIAFDNSDINTAMVSTFLLFLQGSDLDIDAVTLLGYAFDQNGKFVGWSPYFNITSKETLTASKQMPLPTGTSIEVTFEKDKKLEDGTIVKASPNFFELYDEFFGTLFKTIPLTPNTLDKTTPIKTKKGVPQLKMEIDSPEGIASLAKFLRIVNEYGINLKEDLVDGKFNPTDANFYKAPNAILEDGRTVLRDWNLFAELGINKEYTYQIAKQLVDFVNTHNLYITNALEHLRDAMAKNYVVYYIYKTAESPCNQTEAMLSVDVATLESKLLAASSPMAVESDYYAPGRTSAKVKSVGEGLAGKDGVGIGAVGIKANSTTLYYISELFNYGSESDKKKILFKPKVIAGKVYEGFSNMYTSKQFSKEEIAKFELAWNYMSKLYSLDQVTRNVALDIAAMLSLAVDNAKDLALAKINSGPKLMGLYIYGMSLGIPTSTLVDIINSEEGAILKELTEGSLFNNDITAFKVLDVFDKLNGNIGGELVQFSMKLKDVNGKNAYIDSSVMVNDKRLGKISSTVDLLFAAMYDNYLVWFDKYKDKIPHDTKKEFTPAENINEMLRHFFSYPSYKHPEGYTAFEAVYKASEENLNTLFELLAVNADATSKDNWIVSRRLMVEFIIDMSNKSRTFNTRKGRDLKVLAEGAEEMRILGSILGINKGLKPTFSEAESYIDTIENLIYDRKKVMGMRPSEKDKIDFVRFMTDTEYLEKVIEAYEKVKHSVNIPHLLTKAPHFRGYVETQMIPTKTFLTNSVLYRALHKYRANVRADNTNNTNPISIFNFFNVDAKKDKDSILKGLENLVNFKLFMKWAAEKKLQFKLPAGFKYFTRKVAVEDIEGTNNDGLITAKGGELIPLYTEVGIATFKKYMEEYYIPQLQSGNLGSNEFVKNLVKIENDHTPVHNTVVTYSLPGDLMARLGRLAELNQRMFSDFKRLTTWGFLNEVANGIPSVADAFFIYALYCYMGKKGLSSLMNAFDYVNSKHDLRSSFNTFIALMDVDGDIECSEEQIITWCAPVTNLFSKANWAYVTSMSSYGLQLKQKSKEAKTLEDNDDMLEALQAYLDAVQDAIDSGEYIPTSVKENYVTYEREYMSSYYSNLTLKYFLVPTNVSDIDIPIQTKDVQGTLNVNILSDGVASVNLWVNLLDSIDAFLQSQQVPKYANAKEFEAVMNQKLKGIKIPFTVSLYSDNKKETDFGILQNVIDILLNC